MLVSLEQFLNNIKLRNKLIIFFCILLIIPIAILGMFTYNYFIILIQQKSINYNSEIQKLMIEKVDKYFNDVNSVSLDIAYSSNIQDYFSKKRSYFRNDALKSVDLENEVQSYLFTRLAKVDNINSICIYANDYRKLRAYKSLQDIDYNYELFRDDWYPRVKQLDRDKILIETHYDKGIFNSDEKVISLVRKIYNISNYSETGVLVINISLDIMKELCRDILQDEGVKLYIVDSEGFIIYSNNEKDIMLTLLPDVKRKMTDLKGSFTVNTPENQLFVTYDTSSYSGWKIAISMPYKNLVRESNIVGAVIAIVVLFICAFLVFLIMYVSSRITFPIKKLEECMQDAEQSNFTNRFEVNSNDEIGHLGKNFNNLMDKINELFSEIYREQGLKREAEITALQAQINPHFLYNTLNTMKWMAVIQKADKMAQIIDDLTALLQFTAKKTEELISIDEEVETLKKYINIQKFRYYDRFDVKFDIPRPVLDMRILKFTLQPIIENSIFHGFETLTSGGLIEVKGEVADNDVKLTIKDNGVGMDEEKAREILLKDTNDKNRFNKIGINNVHRRIRLHFGEKYGLTVNSSPGNGTEVTVLIPIIQGVDQSDKSIDSR